MEISEDNQSAVENKDGDALSVGKLMTRLQSNALGLVGIRYRYGGSSPRNGFDCSGLVQYVLRSATGLSVGRTAAIQAREGESVRRDQLRVGDLVFFNTLGRRFSHVGIYIGNEQFLHAPSAGGAVRVEDLRATYWKTRFTAARRLIDADSARQRSSVQPGI